MSAGAHRQLALRDATLRFRVAASDPMVGAEVPGAAGRLVPPPPFVAEESTPRPETAPAIAALHSWLRFPWSPRRPDSELLLAVSALLPVVLAPVGPAAPGQQRVLLPHRRSRRSRRCSHRGWR